MMIDNETNYYCGFVRLNPLDITSPPAIEWDTDKRYAKIMSHSQAKFNLDLIKKFDEKSPAKVCYLG